MSDLNELIENINDVCQKIAERDGLDIKIGGYIKNRNGKWSFVEGNGSYEYKDNEFQWKLKTSDIQNKES